MKVPLLLPLVNDAVVLVFCSSIMFIIIYSVIAPWWRTTIGVAMVTLDLGIAMLVSPAAIDVMLGDHSMKLGLTWYTLASLAIVTLAINWRTIILVRDQVKNTEGGGHDDGSSTDD